MELNNKNAISLNDFHVICRVCLATDENMFSLTSKEILLMLEECSTVNEEYSDKLPQQICKNCFWRLKKAYNFKQQCNVSLQILYNLLKHEESDNKVDLHIAKAEIEADSVFSAYDFNTSDVLKETDSNLNENNCDLKKEFKFSEFNEAGMKDYDENNDFDNYVDDDDDDDDDTHDNNSVSNDPEDNDVDNNDNEEKNEQIEAQKERKHKSVADILIKRYNIYGLTCNICFKELSNRFSMLRHMEVHDQNRSLKYHCKMCNKGFYAAENLKKHEIRHLGKTKYQCDLCPKRFYVLSALGVHCKSSHKVKPIQCSKCSQQFYHQLQVEQHMPIHEEKKFVCEDCGKIFPTKNRLSKHKKIHSDERPYKCNMCESAFKQKFNLTIHQKLRHLECDRREMCNVCGKLFHPGSLRAHLETHDENTIHCCQQCGKIYKNRIILAKHINQKHKNTTKRNTFYCEICSKALGSSGSLKKHMIVMHTTLEKSNCHLCGKSYKSPNGVKVHILSAHMDVRPFICETCNKAFHSKNVLEKHVRTHTGERPFSCDICGKAFGFKQVLKTHMKVHSK